MMSQYVFSFVFFTGCFKLSFYFVKYCIDNKVKRKLFTSWVIITQCACHDYAKSLILRVISKGEAKETFLHITILVFKLDCLTAVIFGMHISHFQNLDITVSFSLHLD